MKTPTEAQFEGITIAKVTLNAEVLSQSLIKPIEYPEGDEFYLVPVEYPECCFEHRIVVPAFYSATCLKSHDYLHRGCPKRCLTWGFFLSDCEGLTLAQHFNIPEKLKTSFLYAQQWMLASGGQRPTRLSLERMSPKIFHGKSAIVLVRLAHPKNPDGTRAHDALRYPVVGYIREMMSFEDTQK